MGRRMAVAIVAFVALTLALTCATLWRNMSRKYVIGWRPPFARGSSESQEMSSGNVCIVDRIHPQSKPLSCEEIDLFPSVFGAIGVNESRIAQWQKDNGFYSRGVNRTGTLIAPGYPIFSRLIWTHIESVVYLQGNELSEFLAEVKQALAASNDPLTRARLDRLAILASKAQQESKILRFS
jgi:hypothetical protein